MSTVDPIPSSRTMVALDNMTREQALVFLTEMPSELDLVKIGLELYCSYGAAFVREVHEKFNKRIFLDLKLHDIPNTVAKTLASLSNLPIEFITVHLSGGRQMLEACQSIRNEKMTHTNILGVSYLTSLDHTNFRETWGIEETTIPAAFMRLFSLASETKTQGIVCSAQELKLLSKQQESANNKLMSVCPGIRFQDEIDNGSIGDQRRVLTPSQAFDRGADYIVMGRSLTQAEDLKSRVAQLNLVNS